MSNNGIAKKAQSPVERQIFLKKRLIRTLEKEIAERREATETKVKQIKFRIEMARTLLNALEKGQ